jgi:hypothetical protein
MPTQQRVRTDEERACPASEQLAGRGKEDAVRLIQPWTRDLAAKHSQFVAEHHDPQLFELARAQTQRRHRKRPTKRQVRQRHQQQAASLHPGPRRRPTLGRATQLREASNHGMDLRARHGLVKPHHRVPSLLAPHVGLAQVAGSWAELRIFSRSSPGSQRRNAPNASQAGPGGEPNARALPRDPTPIS